MCAKVAFPNQILKTTIMQPEKLIKMNRIFLQSTETKQEDREVC